MIASFFINKNKKYKLCRECTKYINVFSLTRVDEVSLRVQQDLQRLHVVVQILEHGRALAQDAISREERPLLLQQQGHVVVSVARGEQHSGKNEYQTWLC